MSIPKFVLALVAEMEEGVFPVAIVDFVLWEEIFAMVALNLVEPPQASCWFVTNNNPVWLNIGNEIVSVSLRRGGHRNELWLACFTADCHDLEV
jgi:hypothetical protein